MIEIYDTQHMLVGESIVYVARKIGKPNLFEGSNKHRSNRLVVDGTDRDPAVA